MRILHSLTTTYPFCLSIVDVGRAFVFTINLVNFLFCGTKGFCVCDHIGPSSFVILVHLVVVDQLRCMAKLHKRIKGKDRVDSMRHKANITNTDNLNCLERS